MYREGGGECIIVAALDFRRLVPVRVSGNTYTQILVVGGDGMVGKRGKGGGGETVWRGGGRRSI